MVLAASLESLPKLLLSPRFSIEGSSDPINLQPSQLPLVAEVKAKLQDGAYGLETSPCVCGEATGVVISEVDRYGLPLTFVLCTGCGTIRIDPYLDTVSLEDFYTRFYQQMYARATDVDSYFVRQSSYGEKVLAVAEPGLRPGSWVFEVGCGAGGALDVFRRQGYQVAGCDYSGELIAAGRLRGVQNLYHGSLKDIEPHLDGAKADLIYLNHVFEHVKQPLRSLDECRNQLAPGGKIVIIVPDVSGIDSFPYPAGDLLKFLHIAHKYNFSYEGLRRLAGQGSYQVRRLTPDPKIQTPTSHSPELWLEFVVDENAPGQNMKAAISGGDNHGTKMLHYLRRTEKLYALGLCRGQLRERLNASKNSIGNNLGRLSRVTPAKVIRKLKGI
jgi:SAM-dependent methyltransferase